MTNTETVRNIVGEHFDVTAVDEVLKKIGLQAGATVLDVGTGKGNNAIFLASHGYQVVTGEPSADTTRYARQDWGTNAEKAGVRDRIRFQDFDASKMPFDSQSFDAVFFYGVLHHIEEAVRADVFREALRVAKNAVVFFEPKKETLERLWTEDPGHPHAAKPSEYLADEGVREERMQGQFMDVFIFESSQ